MIGDVLKISDVVPDWPLDDWAPGEAIGGEGPEPVSDPGSLRLLGFTGPDPSGWFSLTATDDHGAEWSHSFCVSNQQLWSRLEDTFADNLRKRLAEVGELVL